MDRADSLRSFLAAEKAAHGSGPLETGKRGVSVSKDLSVQRVYETRGVLVRLSTDGPEARRRRPRWGPASVASLDDIDQRLDAGRSL